MQAVKGAQRRHHFRHHHGALLDSDDCNESRLHYDAKHTMARIINERRPLTANYTCGCGNEHTATLGPFVKAEVERKADWHDMTRTPDVTAFRSASPAAYFEVVVKHPPDYDTSDDRIEVPVIAVQIPDQEHLDELVAGIIRDGNYPRGPCLSETGPDIPRSLIEQWQRAKDRPFKVAAWSDLERMRHPIRPSVPLNRWRIDSFTRDGTQVDRYLRSDTMRDLHRRAEVLLWRGFIQHKTKPGLFLFETPKVTLYASLRSTDVLNVWDAPEPALFAFPRRGVPRDSGIGRYATALIQYAHWLLQQTPASARVHFYDDWKLNEGGSYQPLVDWWSEPWEGW